MDFFSKKNRILLKELIKTDFKLRYQGSLVGYLWSILKPLMMFTIMYLVFVRFLRFFVLKRRYFVLKRLKKVLKKLLFFFVCGSFSAIYQRNEAYLRHLRPVT